jgi:glycosyltransferase involved in cell wall biosynthesis
MPIVSYLDKLFSLQNFFGIFLIKGSDYLTKDFIYIEDLENTSLSLFTIYQISIQKKVFLMIRNYWLVTGHCIYPDGCDKWKMKCSQCPSLQTSIPLKFDTTRLLFQLKLSLLSRSNIEIIVETEEAKRGLRHSSIIGRKKIHVIEPAIKNNFLKAQDQLTSRDELNIPHDVIVIGIRGAIKKTDKERILNIFSDLPSHQRIYLVTIGAEYVINVINVIHINIKNSDTLDSEDNIILLCNIWIILDYFMGLSRFILKAMCLQKLLISTNLDGVSALLRNPDGGIVIPSKQFLNVKSAIIYLLGNLIEIASYGEAAAKVAQDHYQQDNFRTSIAQLLLESN